MATENPGGDRGAPSSGGPWAGLPSRARVGPTLPGSSRGFRTGAFSRAEPCAPPGRSRGRRRGLSAVAGGGFGEGTRARPGAHVRRRAPGRRAEQSQLGRGRWLWRPPGRARGLGAQATAGAGAYCPKLPRALAGPAETAGLHALSGQAQASPVGRRPNRWAQGASAAGHLAGQGKTSEGRSVRNGEGEAKCGQGACAV